MKNAFVFIILFSYISLLAQDKMINFGVKAGLNYGDNGKIEISDAANVGKNILSKNADNHVGYHIGVFVRGNITDNFYIKPELQYTLNRSSFDIDKSKIEYDIKKIDLPILAGVKVFGPLHVFGGPSLQYIVKNELKNVKLGNVKNEFTVGLQFGVGVQFGRLNADVRYERGLSKNEAQSIDKNTGLTTRVDSRPNQFLLSLALDL